MRTWGAIALLLGLQALTALAREVPLADNDKECTCINATPPDYQLIREGTLEEQIKLCDNGKYCDCKTGEIKGCFDFVLTWRFEESTGKCVKNFDCRGYLTPPMTSTPAPVTTSSGHSGSTVRSTTRSPPTTWKPASTTPGSGWRSVASVGMVAVAAALALL